MVLGKGRASPSDQLGGLGEQSSELCKLPSGVCGRPRKIWILEHFGIPQKSRHYGQLAFEIGRGQQVNLGRGHLPQRRTAPDDGRATLQMSFHRGK